MIKENLYCIPYEKRVLRSSKGVAYHCEKEGDAKKKSPSSSKSPKDHKSSKMERCNVCGKEFKDMRSMKIHKTKLAHHEEKPKSSKKKSSSKPKKADDIVMKSPIKQNDRKRNRSYSVSPYEKRAFKAMIREGK